MSRTERLGDCCIAGVLAGATATFVNFLILALSPPPPVPAEAAAARAEVQRLHAAVLDARAESDAARRADLRPPVPTIPPPDPPLPTP